MSTEGAAARRTTMLDRLLKEGATGFGTGLGLEAALKDAVNIEASEPFEYLRERTQHIHEEGPGGDLSAADFPDCHPGGLAEVAELVLGQRLDYIPPVFLEGSFPTDRATAFDPRPAEDAGIISTDLEAARAGVLVFCTEGWPREISVSMPQQTRYVLRVVPYVDLGLADSAIHGPPMMWLIPLSEDGKVLVEAADNDIAIFVFPIPEGSDWNQEEGARLVHYSLRATLYGALFSICCSGALGDEVEVGPSHSAGVDALHIGGLAERLDKQGRAKELGLGHALTVCRDTFGPAEDEADTV